MSDTSIVTHNRMAQFVARFERQADGSVIYYHPNRATGGLRCTQEECEQLIQAFARTQSACFTAYSAKTAFWHRTAALPASLIIGRLLPGAGLTYYAIEGGWVGLGWVELDMDNLVIIGSTGLMTGIWFYARSGRWK